MPHGYGQLGCSGFVISDEDGYFITRKSSAFLQYGEKAFRDVERILSKYMVKNVTVASSQTVVKAAFLTDETVRKAQEEKKVCYENTSICVIFCSFGQMEYYYSPFSFYSFL